MYILYFDCLNTLHQYTLVTFKIGAFFFEVVQNKVINNYDTNRST